ncbi:Holliday junction resolvase RuvX [Halorhodospira abdelmalekii]|uniref:Holliday junction resolvase RuvX n=1 Tax=Halorhodospira abdelmalekii TaxID=421629 RepID=UPI0019045FB7|nr:Holliday junction resolvase RuvX [Halorhodospira abdelmalekii]MBK1735266.1 Holliday junction resolvase RuvX [Halorhodospira abdelmalekii]
MPEHPSDTSAGRTPKPPAEAALAERTEAARYDTATLGTVLGFDPGARTIGVAVGEALLGSARALSCLRADDGLPRWAEVDALLAEWSPQLLLVGLPRHADGSDSNSTQTARRLSRALEARYALPVATVDERLSSHEATQRLEARSPSRRRSQRNADRLHAEAAAVIVETFLAQI